MRGERDVWAGFGRWEPHHELDVGDLRMDTYRGMVWRYAEVGKTWAGVAEVAWLVAILVLGLLQAYLLMIVALAAAVPFMVGVQQMTKAWGEDHNRRVAAARLRRDGPSPERHPWDDPDLVDDSRA